MAFGDRKGTLSGVANSITNPFAASGSVACVVGDLVVAVLSEQTDLTAGATPTDNLGNVYAAQNAGSDAGNVTGRAYWSRVTVAGTLTSISVAATASNDNVVFGAAVYEGPFSASPLDATPANATNDLTSTFACPATGTLAQAAELVVAWMSTTSSAAYTATSPNLLDFDTASSTVAHVVIGSQVVAATTTVTPVFASGTNPAADVLGTMSFKQDSSTPNRDWPNPRGAIPSIDLRTWVDPLKLQLIGKDAFFRGSGVGPNYDWPNPPLGRPPASDLRTFLNPVEIQLIGKDTFFGAPGQVPDFDWPNPPLGRPAAVELRTWLQGFNPLLQVGVTYLPCAVTDWNVPAPIVNFDLRTQTQAPSIALGVVVAAPPPNLKDWPNPRGPTPAIMLRTFLQEPPLPISFPVDSANLPSTVTDWLNPTAAVPGSTLRTWIGAVQQQLIGQDTFFGGPGYAPDYDWPNPRGAIYPVTLRTFVQQFQSQLYTITATLSPTNYDWPNPRGATPSIALRTWLDPVKLQLLGKDAFFGAPGQPPANLDWPVPRGATPSIELRTWLQGFSVPLAPQAMFPCGIGEIDNPLIATPRGDRAFQDSISLALTFVSTAAPFAQNNWQNPRGPIAVIDLRTWIDALKLNLVAKDQFFGTPGQPPANLDWPVPRGPTPSIDLRTWLQTAQAIAVTYLPCTATGWANPWGATPSIALRTWTQQFQAVPMGPAPFAQTTWPNPRGPIPGIDLRTWTDPLKLELQGKDQFFGGAGQPPANLNWPVPRGPTPAIALRTWLQGFSATLAPLFTYLPCVNTDWSNPASATPSIALRTWSQRFQLLPAGPAPFAQNSWPNPRGPVAGSHWLQGFSLPLQPAATVYLPCVATGWSNPPGPRPAISLRTWTSPYRPEPTYTYRQPLIFRNWTRDPHGIAVNSGTWTSQFRIELLTAIVAPIPSINRDWPNPRGATPSIALRSWLDPVKLNLIGKDTFYGAPGQPPTNRDWPVPRAATRAIELRTWLQGVSATLAPQAAMLPCGIGEIDNPLVATPRGDRAFQGSISLALTAAPTASPFRNIDWPNPRAATPPIGLRTWSSQFASQLYAIAQALPPTNYDWPNPRGATPAIALRTWLPSNSQLFTTTVALPPANLDWPNPRGYVPGVALRTWIDPVKLNLIGQDTFFRGAGVGPNYDYPNPRGAIPSIALRTFVDPTKRQLIGKDTFFRGAGVGPVYDYPNPRGYIPASTLRIWLRPHDIDLFAHDYSNLVQPCGRIATVILESRTTAPLLESRSTAVIAEAARITAVTAESRTSAPLVENRAVTTAVECP